MIEMVLRPSDPWQVRLAISPIQELLGSQAALTDPPRAQFHRRWLTGVRATAHHLNLSLTPALLSRPRRVPAFLTPTPDSPSTSFRTEVERVRATSPATVRRTMDLTFGGEAARRSDQPAGAGIPRPLTSFYTHPDRHLADLAEELTAYWNAVMEPVWPRIRSLLDADIAYRSAQLTTGGTSALLTGLHERVAHTSDRVTIASAHSWTYHLDGIGLLLVPSAFIHPHLRVVGMPGSHHPPMITYSARGIAALWSDQTLSERSGLEEVIGHSRACILAVLQTPLSTGELARVLGIAASTTSEHLSALRKARLITSRRSGRRVLHQRTDLGDHLLRSP